MTKVQDLETQIKDIKNINILTNEDFTHIKNNIIAEINIKEKAANVS